jgi:type IV pilus assembly protein PilE
MSSSTKLSPADVFGFTLIELMIAVLIIGIIALVALPSYENYVIRARRADAKTFLSGMAQQLERCYSRFGAYNHASCSVGAGPFNSTEGYYTVALTNRAATTYTLTATPKGPQLKDSQCTALSINHIGQHTATGSLGNACWDR